MPWPVPSLLDIKQPKQISARKWLPALFAIASVTAGAVLLLWPHGRSTQTLEFWALFVGVPLIACLLIFGVVLDRWESEQVSAEEGAYEQERLMGLWRLWCCRHLRVRAALAITPVPASTFDDIKIDLPINKDRSKGLVWKTGDLANEQYGRVVAELVSRLKESLEDRREVFIDLLHTETPERIDVFRKELKVALERAATGVKFTMNGDSPARCAQWITGRVDRVDDATVLIIAPQIWLDEESPRTFTEGVAALLLEPNSYPEGNKHGRSMADSLALSGGSQIFRPMTTTAETLEADVAQMVEMQITPQQPTHLWHTGCDAQLSASILSAMKADPKHPVVERSFDHIVGRSGPASNWLMLATALEVVAPGAPAQLLAWRDPVDEQLHLCMIAPAAEKHDSKGKRSES